MKTLLRTLRSSTFLKDNVILFLGTFLAGVLGFFYHFYMGRVLGVVDYGILGTILAGVYLFNASFVNTIQTSIAKFTSEFRSKQEEGKIKYLFSRSFKKLFLVGTFLYLIYFLFTPWLSAFLRIERSLLVLSGVLIILSLLLPIGRGILQGLQNFKGLSFNLLIEGVAKLSLGILFVYLSYQVMGAMVAVILSYVIPIFFFIKPFKKYAKIQPTVFAAKHIYLYSLPVFIMIITLTLFFTLDVILVKHLFTEAEAGFYSALSLLGKIIFFGTISISQVMFPKVSESFARGEKTLKLFFKSLLVTLFCIFCALFVYTFFPNLLVLILFGKEFLPIAGLVGWFGFFIALVSLVYLVAFYLISLKRFAFIYLFPLFNLIEIFLLFRFHASLAQVVYILVILMALLLFLLFLVLFFVHKKDIFKRFSVSLPP